MEEEVLDDPDLLILILRFLKEEKHVALHICLAVNKRFQEIALYLEPYYNPLGAWLRYYQTPPPKSDTSQVTRLRAKHGIPGHLESLLWYLYYENAECVKEILDRYPEKEVVSLLVRCIEMPDTIYMKSTRSVRGESNLWTVFEIIAYKNFMPGFALILNWILKSSYWWHNYTRFDEWGMRYVLSYARLEMYDVIKKEVLDRSSTILDRKEILDERENFFDEGRTDRLCALYLNMEFGVETFIRALVRRDGAYNQSRRFATFLRQQGERTSAYWYIYSIMETDFVKFPEEEILSDMMFIVQLGIDLKIRNQDYEKEKLKVFVNKLEAVNWEKVKAFILDLQ